MKQPDTLRALYYLERARTLYALPAPPSFPERLEGMIEEWEARRREFAAPLCGVTGIWTHPKWQAAHSEQVGGDVA